MSDVHTCSKCDSILLNAHPITKYQKSFELPVSSLLELSSGPNPCNFFKALIENCRWPQGYVDNNPSSRIAILFDDYNVDSYGLSVASLPRRPEPDTRKFRSAVSRYGELLEWQCQVFTSPGMRFCRNLVSEADIVDDPAAIDVPGRILQPLVLSDDTTTMIKNWDFTCR